MDQPLSMEVNYVHVEEFALASKLELFSAYWLELRSLW